MRNILFTAVLILAIAVAGYLFIEKPGFLYDENDFSDEASRTGVVPNRDIVGELAYDINSTKERTIIELKREEISSVDLDTSLYGQNDIHIYDGELFVSDFMEQKVFRFTKKGKFINDIGDGQGQGPKEFGHFIDFVLTPQGVFFADINSRKISWFTLDGELVESFRFDGMPNKISYFDDSLAVFSISRGEILKISNSGEFGTAFGQRIGSQGTPVDIDGYLSSYDNKWLIYASMYSSTVMVFDIEGNLHRTIQTIDQQPFPRSTPSNGAVKAPKQSRKVYDVAVDEGNIYLNTNVDTGTTSYTIIDRYEFQTGQYLDSIKLPYPIKRMDVDRGVVYAVLFVPGIRKFKFDDFSRAGSESES